MNIQEYTTPEKLEKYAFLWSELRLVIAAFSLFFGAVPIAYIIIGYRNWMGFGLFNAHTLLPLFWLISGAASVYLIYTWHQRGQTVLGGKKQKDIIAFFIMTVSGINLGLAAITHNIGMSLVWGIPTADILFKLTALIYLAVAYYLYTRWKEHGEKIF